MTILSANTLNRRKGIISPFHRRTKFMGMTYGLGPAGYDVRIDETMGLKPGEAKLASTMERFDIPNDVMGMVVDKSTWARRFVAAQNTVIEPGWRGHLTLELSNHGVEEIFFERGMPIVQIVFYLLDEPTTIPYNGKYQDQRIGAVAAILE